MRLLTISRVTSHDEAPGGSGRSLGAAEFLHDRFVAWSHLVATNCPDFFLVRHIGF